jgi:CheY-like chemotaxis protein
MSDLYSLEILRAAERTAFKRVLAMGGLSDILGRLDLFRAAMLRTLLHQPTLHEHIFFDPDEATTPIIRALVLEDDPLVATAHREMLWMLAPDADVTVCRTQEEALKHLAATRRKPNLLLVDLCLDEKHTGHLSFLQIVGGSQQGATFVDAMKDIEDAAQPALSDGRALVIALSSQALNRAQELSLLHRGVHGVVQKPLTTATLRCAVGMVWE